MLQRKLEKSVTASLVMVPFSRRDGDYTCSGDWRSIPLGSPCRQLTGNWISRPSSPEQEMVLITNTSYCKAKSFHLGEDFINFESQANKEKEFLWEVAQKRKTPETDVKIKKFHVLEVLGSTRQKPRISDQKNEKIPTTHYSYLFIFTLGLVK